MFSRIPLSLTVLALLACGETTDPSQPDLAPNPSPAALSLAAAHNTWTPRAPTLFDQFTGDYDIGTAPNAAGQSIVYTIGGVSSDNGFVEGGVTAYNVATDTWTRMPGRTDFFRGVFLSNGVAKLGSRLYFSGGYVEGGSFPPATRQVWAYDYTTNRMINRANLPIFSAEGVTAAIDGKLYVLPGACSGDGYPSPGYCIEEQTRRFYRYDPATNVWVSRLQAPHFHRRGAAAVINGKFYVAGGLAGSGTPVAALDVYDPATNTWRSLASLPKAGVAAGAALQGQFYVLVGGSTYAYNPLTNRWIAKAPPIVFGSVVKVFLDGTARLFVAGGTKSALYTP